MYKKMLIAIFFANIPCFFFASQKTEIYLIDLFPTFKEKQVCRATKILLENNVDPNFRPNIGYLSPLMWAMKNNNKKLARLLLEKGANPYHVITSNSDEQKYHYATPFIIVASTPWRQNAFMMGPQSIRDWLCEYVNVKKQK